MRTTAWSFSNGGTAALIIIREVEVRIIEDGHGEYASSQCPPTGYSDEELLVLAQEAVEKLCASDGPLPTLSVGRLTNTTARLFYGRKQSGLGPIVEIVVPRRG